MVQKNLQLDGLVSVIIPTYNRSLLLQEAIKSVLQQTYRPIECIVVDDGSIDGTKEMVESFINNQDAHFTLIYTFHVNAGSQVARNTGTKVAIGQYIQYLDSDDILYPDKLSKQVSFLKDHKDCDGVFGDWEAGMPNEKNVVTACKGEDMIAQMLVGRCIANFSFLMRRSIIEKIGEWDINIKRNQEIDFHLTGLIKGGQFHHQPLVCGLWRTHNSKRIGSTTGLAELLKFFNKWEINLKRENKMNETLGYKLGNLLLWHIYNSKNNNQKDLLAFLKKAISFNPALLGFNESRKIKILSKIVGKHMAFKIWSAGFRKSVMTERLRQSEDV